MRGSLRIARISGIDVFIHWTFLILLAWIGLAHVQQGLSAAAEGIGLVLAVFGCVVLHELGHALAARRFGIPTRDITLYPIGGVARLERIPEEPRQELWVAIAGPAVNLGLAVALGTGLYLYSGLVRLADVELVGGDLLAKLLAINVALALFNLLPAFPMDGGRVLRALLGFKLSHVRATQIAASVGQILAILLGFVGLFANWFLVFVALFVYLGAQQEARVVVLRGALRGIPVRQAMMTRFHALSVDDSLEDAIRELLASDQQDFPVIDGDGRVVGFLPRGRLLTALAEGHRADSVRDVMLPICAAVQEGEMLDGLFERMRAEGCHGMPVLRGDRLVGVVTLENVGEWLLINEARSGVRERSGVEDVFSR